VSFGGIYLWWLGGSVYFALADSMLAAGWRMPLSKALRNCPFGIPSMLPFNIGKPNNDDPI
jgi:hypothetical protein